MYPGQEDLADFIQFPGSWLLNPENLSARLEAGSGRVATRRIRASLPPRAFLDLGTLAAVRWSFQIKAGAESPGRRHRRKTEPVHLSAETVPWISEGLTLPGGEDLLHG